ncbi:MAG: hypothetical protein PHE92_07555 [Candidatus Cloacimonetes bacterium]|nr:hypothetical protein [Candidatus Cloacimonadota bacterium]
MSIDIKNPDYRQLVLFIDFQYIKELLIPTVIVLPRESDITDNRLKKIINTTAFFSNYLLI